MRSISITGACVAAAGPVIAAVTPTVYSFCALAPASGSRLALASAAAKLRNAGARMACSLLAAGGTGLVGSNTVPSLYGSTGPATIRRLRLPAQILHPLRLELG